VLLLSGFIDTFYGWNPRKKPFFRKNKETLMNMVTSWMEQGIAQAEEKPHARETARIIRQLCRTIGTVPPDAEQAIGQISLEQNDQLSDALFDFSSEADLATWLDHL
jgi:hypothetical protein